MCAPRRRQAAHAPARLCSAASVHRRTRQLPSTSVRARACVSVRACACVCMRALCVRVCVNVRMRACTCARVRLRVRFSLSVHVRVGVHMVLNVDGRAWCACSPAAVPVLPARRRLAHGLGHTHSGNKSMRNKHLEHIQHKQARGYSGQWRDERL